MKSSIYFGFNEENSKEGPKFKIGDTERILKYKKIFFAKDYTPNWSKEVFVTTKVKNTVPWNICH